MKALEGHIKQQNAESGLVQLKRVESAGIRKPVVLMGIQCNVFALPKREKGLRFACWGNSPVFFFPRATSRSKPSVVYDHLMNEEMQSG